MNKIGYSSGLFFKDHSWQDHNWSLKSGGLYSEVNLFCQWSKIKHVVMTHKWSLITGGR